jgi:hypothetical protein
MYTLIDSCQFKMRPTWAGDQHHAFQCFRHRNPITHTEKVIIKSYNSRLSPPDSHTLLHVLDCWVVINFTHDQNSF